MPTEILMPALSPTMEAGTLAKWLVKVGDKVQSGDLLAEIETDKAVMEMEAAEDGVIGKLLVADGSEGVKINTPIAILLGEGEDVTGAEVGSVIVNEKAPPVTPALAHKPEKSMSGSTRLAPLGEAVDRIFATPLARRIAKDKGLDLNQIGGSGPRGRIVKADVEDAKTGVEMARPRQASAAETLPPREVAAAEIAKSYQGREFEEVQLDGMRKTIAARLTEAKQTIPHFYLRRDIHVDALLEFRSELNRQLAPRDIKLSLNDFIIKACALALQRVPDANAIWAGDRIFRLKPSDVAVAVAIPGGLYTPVLKDADTKTLTALSAEMKDLAARAQDRKLTPQEYQGGSFAISNLGMYGIENFDAVINPPHGAILAVGTAQKKPVVNDAGALAVGTVMSVTLSVDHRVIDGALGAELLAAIKSNLESPLSMLV